MAVLRKALDFQMTSAPTNLPDVPPYQVQSLISGVADNAGSNSFREDISLPFMFSSGRGQPSGPPVEVICAEALGMLLISVIRSTLILNQSYPGSEIYIGCSNGELLRYALQADKPDTVCQIHCFYRVFLFDAQQLESYSLLSRQTLPNHKPIDEIVLVPCISRALILSGISVHPFLFTSIELTTSLTAIVPERQIHFYTLPSLDAVPLNVIKPLRNVVTFAVDYQHMQRPPQPLSAPISAVDPIEFCVVKRSNILMFNLRERLRLEKVNLPNINRIQFTHGYAHP